MCIPILSLAVLSLYYCTAVSVLAGTMDQPEDGADDGCHDPDAQPGVPRVPAVYYCSYLYCIVVLIVRVYEEPGPVGDGGLAIEEPIGMEVHCLREVNNLQNVIEAACTRNTHEL